MVRSVLHLLRGIVYDFRYGFYLPTEYTLTPYVNRRRFADPHQRAPIDQSALANVTRPPIARGELFFDAAGGTRRRRTSPRRCLRPAPSTYCTRYTRPRATRSRSYVGGAWASSGLMDELRRCDSNSHVLANKQSALATRTATQAPGYRQDSRAKPWLALLQKSLLLLLFS